eukprot:30544-Pyramimonas_sp.AAC.1
MNGGRWQDPGQIVRAARLRRGEEVGAGGPRNCARLGSLDVAQQAEDVGRSYNATETGDSDAIFLPLSVPISTHERPVP